MRTLVCVLLLAAAESREDDWQPIVPESSLTYNTFVKTTDRALETR